ncbi:MFS transporter [Subtercola boreus]|uniref:MFS transporter n=1 Tax=Subtercola boreus TaxID=120213 RepID=A0A3E0WFA8_9MICO|nr:MFS transporter [Subtercola boreus]RFA22727.1 MFS transporter [Subtercola boreus]RFA23082.1 MFS transporter [Subtercola boreus]RFA28835.1 MFS transporter [Subtercola boreus]
MSERTATTDRLDDSEAGIDPITGRSATTLQGTLLLICSCLPVLGAVLLAPILPTLSQVFASTAGADALVPLVLTVPALMIAIIAPFAGSIVDRMGRKRLLVGALVIYAVLGTAPLYLDTLGAILLSRVGVGIAEAAIITCCTTLLADYFRGRRRDRYFGMQTVVTSLAATLFIVVGGILGSGGWRTPFWIYAISLLIAIPVALLVWAPKPAHSTNPVRVKLSPIPWRLLALPCAVTVFGGIVFYSLIVELPYVLAGLGVSDPAVIGLGSAVVSLATAAGAISFRWLARRGVRTLLCLAFGLAAVGLVIVWFASSVPIAIIGSMVTSLGTGILLPTLLTWAVSHLSFEQRGRGTGRWTACLFFGQFASPLILLAIGAQAGGLQPALGILGVASAVVAIAVGLVLARSATASARTTADASAAAH